MSHRNQIIEYIARKSLICLILTFVVNLAMNLFKVTKFLGNRSDVSFYWYIWIETFTDYLLYAQAFTVYFEIIESTLLVEALRVDYTRLPDQSFCEHCGMVLNSYGNNDRKNLHQQQINEQVNNINIPGRTSARSFAPSSIFSDVPYNSNQYSMNNTITSHGHIPSTTRINGDEEV